MLMRTKDVSEILELTIPTPAGSASKGKFPNDFWCCMKKSLDITKVDIIDVVAVEDMPPGAASKGRFPEFV